MTLTLDEDEVLSAAIAGIPRVAEFIATVPDDDRSRALEAAEKSYLETARTLGYQDADAQEWASAGHVAIANGGEQLQAADAYLSTNIARLISTSRVNGRRRRTRCPPQKRTSGLC